MADTFAIEPDAGLTETWEWLSAVTEGVSGAEARASFRPEPRIRVVCAWSTLTQEERRHMFQINQRDIKAPSIMPLWANVARVKQVTLSGNNRIYFNPEVVQCVDTWPIVLLNSLTREATAYFVTETHADGATLAENIDFDLTADWLVLKGQTSLLNVDNSFAIQQITTDVNGGYQSWRSTPIKGTRNTTALTTFDGLPILERRPLSGANEGQGIKRRMMAPSVGIRAVYTRQTYPRLKGSKTFYVEHTAADFNYWHAFLDTVRGAWKAFLFPSYMQDLTLSSALVANSATVNTNEAYASTDLHTHETFKRIQIEYNDGTTSEHVISASVGGVLTVSPAVPNDPKVANVSRISYLLKTRMEDSCTWTRNMLDSTVEFTTVTTNEG